MTAGDVLPRWQLLAIVLLGLVVRVGFEASLLGDDGPVGVLGTHLLGDERAYDAFARASAGGRLERTRAFYQEPLYAWLVGRVYAVLPPEPVDEAAFAIPRRGVRFGIIVVQHLLGLLVACLTARLGARVLGARAGFLAGLIVAASGPLVLHESMLLKETLGLLVFVACLWLWLDVEEARERGRGRAFALGLLLGLGILLRGNLYLLLGLVLASLLWRRPRGRPASRAGVQGGLVPAALVLGGALLAIAPATIHNLRLGDFVLTTYQAGSNAAIGQPAEPDPHLGILYAPLRAGRGDAAFEEQDAVALAEAGAGHPLSGREVSAWWWRQVRERIAAHPGVALQRSLEKLVHLFHGREVPDVKDWAFFAETMPWLRTPLSDLSVFGSWALLGLLLLPWRGERGARLFVPRAGVLCVGASLVLFYVMGRYRLSALPALAILAAGAMEAGWRTLRSGSATRRAFVLVAAIGTPLAMAALPLSTEVGGHHNSWSNASSALRSEAALERDPARAAALRDRALAWTEQAIAIAPLFPDAYVGRYKACAASGPALAPLPCQRDAAFRLALLVESLRTGAEVRPLLGGGDEQQVASALLALLERPSLPGQDDFVAPLRGMAARCLADTLRPGEVQSLPPDAVLPLALRLIDISLAIEPEVTLAHVQRGLVLRRLGRLAESEAAYRQALAAGVDTVELHNNLGNLLIDLGRPQEAAAELRRALALRPGDPLVSRNLQRALDAARAAEGAAPAASGADAAGPGTDGQP